ncbi:MAG: 39S ribosomal protein L21, mitochondrial [Paramarteilia canceri]
MTNLLTPLHYPKAYAKDLADIVLQKALSKPSSQLLKRNFAFIILNGEQRRVSQGDVILAYDTHFLDTGPIGTEFQLKKVLLYGEKEFSFIGTPFIDPELVKVKAVITDRSLEYLKLSGIWVKRKRCRKSYRKPYLYFKKITSISE